MDGRLRSALSSWENQIKKLRSIEEKFFMLEASEKPTYSLLFIGSEGKNIAEREALVYTHEDWSVFMNGLNKARAEYIYEKRFLELLIKGFDAEYLCLKVDSRAIESKAVF